MAADPPSPHARFVTVYGRLPVLSALCDDGVQVDKVMVSRRAHGDTIDDIVAACRQRGVEVQRVAPEKVTRVSRNGRHDQGVVADIVAPGHHDLDDWLVSSAAGQSVVVLDGITNPANVGMVMRTATAAGLAVVLPRMGSPDVGPLVLKASAGVALAATVLRAPTAAAGLMALAAAGYQPLGLRASAPATVWAVELHPPVALVLGSESEGVTPPVAALVPTWARIPMAEGVESLNVAVAAGIACFELRRRQPPPAG